MNVVVKKTEPPCKATDLELLGLVEVYSPALKYSLQGTTQGRYLTGGVPPVRFSM